jgi:beta-glucosidase
MTLREKVGQLVSTTPISQLREPRYTDDLAIANGKKLIDMGIGQLGVAARHATPAGSARISNALQRHALEGTRLGIPVLIQDECVHGCKASGSTMFPMSIGMAATWNPALLERMVDAIAAETRARGIRQCFSPTLNLGRDARCGRVEETYGEDAYLAARMGVAFIRTLQRHGVAATPKHFAANFVGDGGRDSHAVHFSERILREVYFPAFEAAVKEAGALSVMIAHTALDGIPCSNNRWLMDEVLRREWGFKGFIVPDNTDVQKNFAVHSQADSYAQSAKWCLEAGLDTDLSWPPPPPKLCYIDHLPGLVRAGKLDPRCVDASAGRVLRVKFQLGLFENPWVDEGLAAGLAQCPAHRALARETAVESMVLLKNEGVLPLGRGARRIAVIGPSAKKARLGGYTCEEAAAVSPWEGIRARAPRGTKLLFAKGCDLASGNTRGFAAAVRAARRADVVLMFMGNSSDKMIGQPETTEGERHDRCNLDLPGVQAELVKAVAKANRKVVVVLQNGSAITMKDWVGEVGAVLEMWYAGAEGGHAVAEVIFGDHSPAGRLPLTFPVTTGQCPLYYNPRPHGRVPDYCDQRGAQHQFAFGHGLGYTRFEYDRLQVRRSGKGRGLRVGVSCRVRNAGGRDGDEVVQLYLRDCYSRVTRPIKELKGFARVRVPRGEARTVRFELGWADFSYLDERLRPALEPGDFRLMLGASSADLRLERTIALP